MTALRLGVQRAVFYLGLRRMDLEPLVGVWPPASRRLRRLSVVLAPEPVAVAQTFYHPFLVEDMTTLLGASRVAPIPIRRGDEKPFTRYIEEASAALLTLPEWLEGLVGLSLESRMILPSRRFGLPASWSRTSRARARCRSSPGPQAAEWMQRPLADRRGLILPVFAGTHGREPRLLDLMEEEWTTGEAARDEITPWISQAFSSVPETSFIRFSDFAEYQAAIGSPLAASASLGGMAAGGRTGESPAPSGLATEEALEELWKSFLGIFLGRCLLSLGRRRGCHHGRRAAVLPHDGYRQAPPRPPPRRSARPRGAAGRSHRAAQLRGRLPFAPLPGRRRSWGDSASAWGREVGILFRITRAVCRARGAGRHDRGDRHLRTGRGDRRARCPSTLRRRCAAGWGRLRRRDTRVQPPC